MERRAFDIADHTTASSAKSTMMPSHLIFTIYLHGATSTTTSVAGVNLAVQEKELRIIPDLKCPFRLEVLLPNEVDHKSGDASFDRKRGTLIVTLPVVKD